MMFPIRRASQPLTLILWLMLAGTAQAFEAAQLTGRWYGEALRDGQQHRFLIHRRADGSFEMDYRIYLEGTLMMARKQSGEWALQDGSTYRTRTTRISDDTGSYAPSTATGYHEDLYTVVSADTHEVKTRHQKSGNETVVRRVADDFVLQ